MANAKKENAVLEEAALTVQPGKAIPEDKPTPVLSYDIDLCVERDVFKNQLKLNDGVIAYLSAKMGDKTFTVKPGIYNYSRNLVDANHISWYRLKENCWIGATGKIEFLGKIELPEITKPVERKQFRNQLEIKEADAYLEAKNTAIIIGHLAPGFYNVLEKKNGFYKIADNQFVKAENATLLEAPALKPLEVIVQEVIDGKWGKGIDLMHNLEDAGYDYIKIKTEVEKIEREKKMAELEPIAREVIAGKWGVGMERNEKLRKAGYNIQLINEKVAEILAAEDEKLFKVGDNVKVIKHFDAAGRPFAILYKKYTIIEIHGKNATISKDSQTVVVNTDNLKKVK